MAIIQPPSTGLTRPKQAQVQTNKVEFNDPVLLINKGEGNQANDGDIGFIFDRGTSDNVGLIWDESTDQFSFIVSAEDGNTDGDIIISSYANIKLNKINSLVFPTADGTSGQVIKTDGSGNLSFTDVVTTLQDVTDNGQTTTNSITVNGLYTTGHILPNADITYDLGSPTYRFREIYLSGNSIDLGGTTISADNGVLLVDSKPVGSAVGAPGEEADKDLATGADNITLETPFEASATDSFGVAISSLYDCMDPEGSVVTIDYGDGEAYVGA